MGIEEAYVMKKQMLFTTLLVIVLCGWCDISLGGTEHTSMLETKGLLSEECWRNRTKQANGLPKIAPPKNWIIKNVKNNYSLAAVADPNYKKIKVSDSTEKPVTIERVSRPEGSLTFSEEIIPVQVTGMDDGKKTNRRNDYNEALINAKLKAIERSGVNINSLTRVVNLKNRFERIRSEANGILLPGFEVIDIGYLEDETYMIILIGKVRAIPKKKGEK